MEPTASVERTESYWLAIKWAYLALAKGRIEYAPSVHSYVALAGGDEFGDAMASVLTTHLYANIQRRQRQVPLADEVCNDRTFFYHMYAELLDAWGTHQGCFYVVMPQSGGYFYYPGPGVPAERHDGVPPHDGLPVVEVNKEETYPWNWQVNPYRG